MKPRDRIRFRELIAEARAQGRSLTEAIEAAYAWLLKPSRQVWR